MTQYRPRQPYPIEAYQLPPNDDMTRILPPWWVIERVTNGTIKASVAGFKDGSIAVTTGNHQIVIAQPGDWLVLLGDQLTVYTDDDFVKVFEPIPSTH